MSVTSLPALPLVTVLTRTRFQTVKESFPFLEVILECLLLNVVYFRHLNSPQHLSNLVWIKKRLRNDGLSSLSLIGILVGSISWFLVAFNAHLYPASSVGRSIRPLVVIILFERLPAFWLRRSTAPLFYCSTAATAPTLMPISLKAPNAFHIIAPKKKEAKEKKRTHCTWALCSNYCDCDTWSLTMSSLLLQVVGQVNGNWSIFTPLGLIWLDVF